MSHTERRKYLTDLTDDQWQIFRPLFPARSGRGAPQRVCRRAIINAIFYAVRSGCPWRLLPREFPNWKTVYGILCNGVTTARGKRFTTPFETSSAESWAERPCRGGDYRQSDGEDDRGRWRARLRREQEGHWSQAARGRGYIGFDSGRSRSRCKYSGPGRRSAPASGPGSIAFPFWQTQSHLCRQRLCEKWFACPSEDIVRLVDSNRTSTRGAQGIHCAAKTLDRGTNLRLAGPVSSPQQRLRAEHRVERIDADIAMIHLISDE